MLVRGFSTLRLSWLGRGAKFGALPLFSVLVPVAKVGFGDRGFAHNTVEELDSLSLTALM